MAVLVGGTGTRFWPVSRRACPKPFVPLLGRGTLLEQTLRRLRPLAPPERTWLVASEAHRRLVRAALSNRPAVQALFEPVGRDTAAAIAWAAASVVGRDPTGLIAVFPADHHIPDGRALLRSVRLAADVARRRDCLVLVGIEPTRPDPAYGYVSVGEPQADRALPVRRFVEKPDAARARRYLRDGRTLWNAGMLVAPAARVLEEVRAHAREVGPLLARVFDAVARGERIPRRRLTSAYRRAVAAPFDRAVLERARGVFAVRGSFAWADLGSWDALKDHLPEVEGENRVRGPRPVFVDARRNLVWNTSGRKQVLLGVEGLIVVDTEDALLVCSSERAQEIRRVVEELSRRGAKRLT